MCVVAESNRLRLTCGVALTKGCHSTCNRGLYILLQGLRCMLQNLNREVALCSGASKVEHREVVRHGTGASIGEVANVDNMAGMIDLDSPSLVANLANATVLPGPLWKLALLQRGCRLWVQCRGPIRRRVPTAWFLLSFCTTLLFAVLRRPVWALAVIQGRCRKAACSMKSLTPLGDGAAGELDDGDLRPLFMATPGSPFKLFLPTCLLEFLVRGGSPMPP